MKNKRTRYTLEQKKNILSQRKKGESMPEFAARVNIHISTLYNWMKAKEKPTSIKPNKQKKVNAPQLNQMTLTSIEAENMKNDLMKEVKSCRTLIASLQAYSQMIVEALVNLNKYNKEREKYERKIHLYIVGMLMVITMMWLYIAIKLNVYNF